jgi:hypothetical protein
LLAVFDVTPAAVAVAVFVTNVAVLSSAVTVYVAVHVTVCPGASVVEAPPQLNGVPSGLPILSSVTVNWVGPSVTFPVFLITYVYVMGSPAAVKSAGEADFVSDSAGAAGIDTVLGVWVGGVWSLSAVAVFARVPALMSAWVRV